MSQKQVMPKSEDLSRSLEINAIWTFDTEFPTIFNKSCTYITFKSAVKHRQLGYGYPRGQTVHLAEATTQDTYITQDIYIPNNIHYACAVSYRLVKSRPEVLKGPSIKIVNFQQLLIGLSHRKLQNKFTYVYVVNYTNQIVGVFCQYF